MRIRWRRVLGFLTALFLIVFALTHRAEIVECVERLQDALRSTSLSWRWYR